MKITGKPPADNRIDFNNLAGREVRDETYRAAVMNHLKGKPAVSFAALRTAVPAIAGHSDEALTELLHQLNYDLTQDNGAPVYRTPSEDPDYVAPVVDASGAVVERVNE